MPRPICIVITVAAIAAAVFAANVAPPSSQTPASTETAVIEQPTEGQTRACPGCGETIPVTAVFCPKCGRYLPDAKPATIACPSCGAVIPAAKITCPKCGAYTKTASPTAPASGTTAAPSSTTNPATANPATAAPEKKSGSGLHGVLRGTALKHKEFTSGGGWFALGGLTKDNILLAGGFGYESYPNASGVPLFVTARFDFAPWVVAPGLYFDAGYCIRKLKSISKDASGLLFGSGLSLNIHAGSAAGLCIDGGARYEMSKKYYIRNYSNGTIQTVEASDGFVLITAGAGLFF